MLRTLDDTISNVRTCRAGFHNQEFTPSVNHNIAVLFLQIQLMFKYIYR